MHSFETLTQFLRQSRDIAYPHLKRGFPVMNRDNTLTECMQARNDLLDGLVLASRRERHGLPRIWHCVRCPAASSLN